MKLRNRYFLLRHGQTDFQVKGETSIYHWPDVPPVNITKKGISQIKKAAKILEKRNIDIIYSSDVFRTRQTAAIVAEETGVKVFFDKRLRDLNLGVYQGKEKSEFYKDFPRIEERFRKRPKAGESWNDLKKRVKDFIQSAESKYRDKNILIVSHGDPLWIFEGLAKGMTDKELVDEIVVKKSHILTGELRQINS